MDAYKRSTQLPFPRIVEELEGLLGARLVAYIAGVTETRAVHEWIAGDREPRSHVPPKLRMALRLALIVSQADDAEVARAWFQGLEPRLDDRSPARLLRDGELDEVGAQILGAARSFVAEG
ncbi:MAG TPA: hypothetical protein VMW62_09830 [Chloroflexota bacterium]|nr:hypothetical protein [Chloroflexota bacterium]